MSTTTIILAAIARENPALPPRWSLARAAVDIVGMGESLTVKNLALMALDKKCLGPRSMAKRAVAEATVILGATPDNGFRKGRLMAVAFPALREAIDFGLWSAEALAETAPDMGEVWACAGGQTGTRPARVLLEHCWPERFERSPFDLPLAPGSMDPAQFTEAMAALFRADGQPGMADSLAWIAKRWNEVKGRPWEEISPIIEGWEIPDWPELRIPSTSGHSIREWIARRAPGFE